MFTRDSEIVSWLIILAVPSTSQRSHVHSESGRI